MTKINYATLHYRNTAYSFREAFTYRISEVEAIFYNPILDEHPVVNDIQYTLTESHIR